MKKLSCLLPLYSIFFLPFAHAQVRVGIGTTTPLFKLDVRNGSINTDSLYRIQGITVLSTSGSGNLFVGNNAGKVNSGNNNFFAGEDAGISNSTGFSNSFSGYESGKLNTIGSLNTFAGFQSGRQNTNGTRNAFFGASAGYTNVMGDDNSFFGSGAGFSNTGNANSLFGSDAGRNNSSGFGNTFFGTAAGFSNTIGAVNTFVGRNAGYSNLTGESNVFIGRNAGYDNTSGFSNVAIGAAALRNCGEGFNQVAIGDSALFHQLSNVNDLYRNTAVGSKAGFENESGSGNCFFGYKAGYSNGLSYNSYFGYGAGESNTAGYRNTFFGSLAGNSSTSGDDNVFIGYKAGHTHTNGNSNTYVGNYAGELNATGDFNTYIGYNTGSANDWSNSTVLGYNATPTANNQVRIGDSFVTSIGGYTGWSNISDGRFKNDFRDDVSGLEFILKLRPVTYLLDLVEINQWLGVSSKEKWKNDSLLSPESTHNEKSSIRYSGFIAQEVEKAAREAGFDFSGVDPPKNEGDLYALRYAEFVVPLVKAVQEQQIQIDHLLKELDTLKNQQD